MIISYKIDKILILTNPITWVCFIVALIFSFISLLMKKTRLDSYVFLWYRMPRLNKKELKIVIKHSEKTIESDTTNYNKWIHRLALNKANKLL